MGFLDKNRAALEANKYHIGPNSIRLDEERYVILAEPRRGKVFGDKKLRLAAVGDINKDEFESLKSDFVSGVAKGYHLSLVEEKVGEPPAGQDIEDIAYPGEDEDFHFVELPYDKHWPKFPEAEIAGAFFAQMTFKNKYAREDLRKDIGGGDLKKVDWREKVIRENPRIEVEKYEGEPLLTYTEKKLFGEKTYAIPGEAGHPWEDSLIVDTGRARELARRLYHTEGAGNLREPFKEVTRLLREHDPSG